MNNHWLSVFLCFLLCRLVASNSDETKEFLYLLEKPEDVYPVQEFKAKPRRDKHSEKPKFLYDKTYPYPRIVEFYASWCPHCQHFKPHYIEFAKALSSVTSQMHITVEIFAVSCVPNKKICSDMGVKGYPKLKLFPAHSLNSTEVNYWELHPLQILRLLGISTDNYGQERQQEVDIENNVPAAPLRRINAEQNKVSHFLGRSKKEIFDDAHLSFDFAMRNAVYTSLGPLAYKPKDKLRDFLKVLQTTFPVSSSLQPVLEDLLSNFKDVIKGDEHLNAIMDKYPPPRTTWSPGCLQHGTGYTCGLWELFHIMSVGLVEWNQLATQDDLIFTTIHVADALRDYIEYFFQCDECRVNFLRDYDACGHDRCNRLTDHKTKGNLKEWIEFPLWLYETHNAVNGRLRQEGIDAHDETLDLTTEYEVMWPPKEKCPSCWLSEGRWDEEEVYRYLRLEYWPEDYKSKLIRSQMGVPAHHDSVQRIEEQKGGEEELTDDEIESSPYQPLVIVALLIALISAGVSWQRKRKFDQKGYHKKRESDLSADV